MHKIYYSLLLLLSTLNHLSAQITFEKTYGGTKDDRALCVKQTVDGGYFIAGASKSFGDGFYDAYLIKTDANGDTVWTKTYGINGDDFIYSALQTSDGGYVISGTCHGNTTLASNSVFLIKTDANGDSLWLKRIGNFEGVRMEGYSIKQTTDGGFIVTGYIDTFNVAQSSDMLLLKLDSNGNTQWSKAIGSLYNQLGYDVCQTYDKGYAIIGYTATPNNMWDGLIVKVDSNGNKIWAKKFDAFARDDFGRSIVQTTDSGFIITGYTDVLAASGRDVTLVKLNATGDLQWAKLYGNNQENVGTYVLQTTDSGFIVCGHTQLLGNFYFEVFVMKTNAVGSILWTKTYGRHYNDFASYVQQTHDGGYVVAGFSQFLDFQNDVLLIKTYEDGTSCTSTTVTYFNNSYPISIDSFSVNFKDLNTTEASLNNVYSGSGADVSIACLIFSIENSENHNNKLLIYPNPSTGVFSIELPNEIESGRIEVFHINGQMVFSEAVNHTSKKTIHLSNIAEGIYFVKLFDGVMYSMSRLVIVE